MGTFKLTLAYDGTNYSGWQFQPGRATLQETLERALATITQQAIRVTASGRTDAGVHALGQVVSFSSDTHLSPEVLVRALNAELPADIVVLACAAANEGFHAIHSAVRKRYRYQLSDGPTPDLFARHYTWHLFETLDAEAMHRAAQGLRGTHDFSSFETSGSPRETSIRTIFDIHVERVPGGVEPGQGSRAGRLRLEVEADGFLYNMVRTIVGTLVEVGKHAQAESWPTEVLAARNRQAAGRTAPPQGLFLLRVDY